MIGKQLYYKIIFEYHLAKNVGKTGFYTIELFRKTNGTEYKA